MKALSTTTFAKYRWQLYCGGCVVTGVREAMVGWRLHSWGVSSWPGRYTQRWRDTPTHCLNLYLYTYLGYLDVHHIFSRIYACCRHFYSYLDLLCLDLRSINGKSSRNTTIKIKTHSCHKLQPTTKASSKWSIGINFLNLLHWKNAWSWYFWIFLKTCVVCWCVVPIYSSDRESPICRWRRPARPHSWCAGKEFKLYVSRGQWTPHTGYRQYINMDKTLLQQPSFSQPQSCCCSHTVITRRQFIKRAQLSAVVYSKSWCSRLKVCRSFKSIFWFDQIDAEIYKICKFSWYNV